MSKEKKGAETIRVKTPTTSKGEVRGSVPGGGPKIQGNKGSGNKSK